MKQLLIACVCALAVSGCEEVRDKTGEMFERGQVYAQRIRVIVTGEDPTKTAASGPQTGSAQAETPGAGAPAGAPMLPAKPGFGADGWFIWAGWRYHQSGLVCPPSLEGFTFSRVSAAEEPVVASCSYFGPEFQALQISRVEDGSAALRDFRSRHTQAEGALTDRGDGRVMTASGSQIIAFQTFPEGERGVLTAECEYESPRHDALVAAALAAAQTAQLAFDKRDRLSGAT